MKSLLRLIALISLVVVAVLCFNKGAAAYARWQELNGINVEVNNLQLTLENLQKQRTAIIAKTGGGGLKGALLRDVMADFSLMLKELPSEYPWAGLLMTKHSPTTLTLPPPVTTWGCLFWV